MAYQKWIYKKYVTFRCLINGAPSKVFLNRWKMRCLMQRNVKLDTGEAIFNTMCEFECANLNYSRIQKYYEWELSRCMFSFSF